MSLFANFDVAGSAMSAQSVRLNVTASNMANAETVASSPEEVYRARHPVFRAVLQDASAGTVGVQTAGVLEDERKPLSRYEPGNPIADEQGYVYAPNISPVEEMVNMISASRSFQSNTRVIESTTQMLQSVLRLGE